MAARKKSQDAWSRLDEAPETTVISYRSAGDRKHYVDVTSQKQELADFLQKRKVCFLIILKILLQVKLGIRKILNEKNSMNSKVD